MFMLITISQTLKNNRNNRREIEDFSDNQTKTSFPDVYSRNYNLEINGENPMDHKRDPEKIEQRSIKIYGEPTNLVKTLTEKITSNSREGNGLNSLFTTTEDRSDSK